MKMHKRHRPRIALISLGCAKNLVDAEVALADILSAGFDLTVEPSAADLVIINTCAFIEPARQESQAAIAAALALRQPGERRPAVAAMGCYPVRGMAELERLFPDLDGIIGLVERDFTPKICRRLLAGERVRCVSALCSPGVKDRKVSATPRPRLLLTPPSYAYLKISEGCDNRCAYCSIPLIRGPMRSRHADAVLAEAAGLAKRGVAEIVLVAQDTTAYDLDRRGRPGLAGLLRRLLQGTEAPRLRILYAHPRHLDDEVMALLASEKRLCRYLDMPIQHVNSRILKAMGRGYDGEHVERLLEKLRKIKGLVLRTTLLAGFPG